MNQVLKTIIISAVIGALFGGVTVLAIENLQSDAKENLIKEFYDTETAIHVSPHGLRKKMTKGETEDYILVDLRSAEEYANEHIITAINIPAYKDPDTSAYDDVERILAEFSKLPPDKDIIVYCYSIPCMTGRKIGKMLADNGVYVKHLGIGWNEWRYSWNQWNHEHEWEKTDLEDYVISGTEPGIPKNKADSTTCPIDGGFGC